MAKAFRGLGLHTKERLFAVTGVRGSLAKKEGAELTIFRRDGCDWLQGCIKKQMRNGTAHACGHHAQLAAMLGAAMALSDEERMESFASWECFFFCGAGRRVHRHKKKKGFRKRGVDTPAKERASLLVEESLTAQRMLCSRHVHMVPVKEGVYLGNPSCNGFLAERDNGWGKAGRVAIAPWDGVNALSS